jgi:hypothetical protein
MLARLVDAALGLWARISERLVIWPRLPFILALSAIVGHRVNLRRGNLVDTETVPPEIGPARDPGLPEDFDRRGCRLPDGTFNDRRLPWMGMAGARFGRNVPLPLAHPERETEILSPNPRLISNTLMTRKAFVPVPHLNVLAAAWIQFMVHDWLSHGGNDRSRARVIPIADDDIWPPNRDPGQPNEPMTVLPTLVDPTRGPDDEALPPAYTNRETAWWDGSQLYGSSWRRMERLRRFRGEPGGERLENGKLWLDNDGMLPLDGEDDMQVKRPGLELSGVNGNWWVGLSLLHTLFAREHNAIVDCLAAEYPRADGEWLFQKARLVNAALMAKIHTVEWTPALMDSPVGRMAMRGNFWGLAGEHVRRGFGAISDSEVVSGIPGTPTDHHGAPYAMTEEFAAVYRLHPLLPDDFEFRSAEDDRHLFRCTLPEVVFGEARMLYERAGFEDVLYSLATQHPGAMVLHNYPNALRALSKKPEEGVFLDVAALDIVRDRERGVPRYNAFRKAIGMAPVRSFDDLTSVAEDRELLRRVYGEIDRVDLLVGCLAEFQSDRQPAGFGFSDTAFRIFILMASRRLKSDRFFTDDYTPETYTPMGFDWIQRNGLKDVLRRHVPRLAPRFADVRNAFYPWARAG